MVKEETEDSSGKTGWRFHALLLIPILISIAALAVSFKTWHTANVGLIATTRPYLSVESITETTVHNDYVSILTEVKNYGKLPASLRGVKLLLDGEQWVDVVETPEVVHRLGEGVTVTGSGIVMWPGSPPEQDFPGNIVFYPEKANKLVIRVLKDKWDRSISVGSVIEICLNYTWGKHDYWYIGTSVLEESGEWNLVLERGN